MGCCGGKAGDGVEEVVMLYGVRDFRYPLTLAGIYIDKRRHPS